MVLPKYSKIQVLPGITSLRLMKYNKQAIELNSLLINNMPNHPDNKQAGHTNGNKQFWPKYKIITITKIWKYSIFTEKPVNLCI